jgi:membrane protease YdiL (CAAX protease family)
MNTFDPTDPNQGSALDVEVTDETAVTHQAEATKLTPVASYLHMVVAIVIMLGVALMSWKSAKQFEQPHSPWVTYLPTIIWLWLLFGFVAAGMRRKHVPLRELFGPGWKSFDDVIMDVVTAAAFWLLAVVVLAVLGLALLGSQRGNLGEATKVLQGLAPHGVLGISMWIFLSVTAGICEEFVFRGYLQRQFSALTQSIAVGVILSAMVFSLGHLYEGVAKAALIGIFGVMFGILAAWRKNLRPGIMAHAWHDIFSGLALSLLTNLHK